MLGQIRWHDTIGTQIHLKGPGDQPFQIQSGLAQDLDFFTNASATMRATILTTGFFGIGSTTPTQLFDIANLFQVSTTGDLVRIKNVPYVWPAANAIGVLTNTGAGTLSWSSAPQGIPGTDGEDGLDSLVPGPQGTPGTNGTNGAIGATGPPGFSGVDGDDGMDSLVPGPQGIAGAGGAVGQRGFPGADGDDGLDGLQGPQGLQGIQGNAGNNGATGPQGPIGLGLDGIDGDDGQPGVAGIRGADGAPGAAGLRGPPGMDGEGGGEGDSFGFLNGPTSPAGLKGEVQFNAGGMFGANSSFFWDITNKRLGIGNNTPMTAVDVEVRRSDGADTDLRINNFSTDSATSPVLSLGRSRGTSPTSFGAILLNDIIGTVEIIGDDGDGVSSANLGASIQCFADENWTGTAHGCKLIFSNTSLLGSSPNINMTIRADRSVDFASDVWPRSVQYTWPNAAAVGVLTSTAGGALSWAAAGGTGPMGPAGPPGMDSDGGGGGDDFALIGPPPPRPTLATRATITIVTETEQYATNIVDGAVNPGSTIKAWTVNELDDIYFDAHANSGNFDLEMRAIRAEFEGGLKGSINIAYQVM
jgi:hypothetical protein